MAQALTHVAFPAPVALKPEGPSDSIRGVAMTGWLVIVLFFGVLGTWAVTAPLNGAVVATGIVKVDGNRKSVQHLDGGIVKELRVREGDKVKAGDVVVVLDEGQARAEFEVLAQQAVVLRATEERLRAELTRATALMMPEDLRARGADAYVSDIWKGQIHQFESRLAAIEGQRSVIKEKVAQLEHQINGGYAQVKAYRSQME